MNQPTEDRFRQFEERQAEFEKRLIRVERQTEPIQITRLEIDSGSIHRRLDEVQEDMGVFKTQIEGTRADVSIVKSNQGDLKEYLEGQFKSIEQKQDAHAELLSTLINFAESHEKNMATKDDVAGIKDDIKRLETAQAEQGDLLKLILAELRKSRGE